MSDTTVPLESNVAISQYNTATGDQATSQTSASPTQNPALHGTATSSPSNLSPPMINPIPAPSSHTPATHVLPHQTTASTVTNADLRTFKYLQELLPTILKARDAAQIAVGRQSNSGLFYAAIIGRKVDREVMWAGPATGATREMALTRLVAQLENLGIYHMNREKAENVLDDFDDDDGSGDLYRGNNQPQSKKRKNGSETRDAESVQKKRRSNESNESGSGGGGDAELQSAHSVENLEQDMRSTNGVAEPQINDDNDNDTAMAEIPTEAHSTSQTSTPIMTHPSRTKDIETEKRPTEVDTSVRKMSLAKRFTFWKQGQHSEGA